MLLKVIPLEAPCLFLPNGHYSDHFFKLASQPGTFLLLVFIEGKSSSSEGVFTFWSQPDVI